MGHRLGSILLRQTNRTGSFITVCFINMLLNFRWSIPAWLLLAAHFAFGFPPMWVFLIALAIWPVAAIVLTAIVRLLSTLVSMSGGYRGAGSGKVVHVEENTPNKNPYSATRQKEENVKAGYSRVYEVEGHDWNAEDTPYGETQEETSGGEPHPWTAPQQASYPEMEGKDWYAEYMASPAYEKENPQGRVWNEAHSEPQDPEKKSVFE